MKLCKSYYTLLICLITFIVFFSLSLIFICLPKTCRKSITVTTKYFKVKGRIRATPGTGKHFISFRGVPFAHSPVGPLRFALPQSIKEPLNKTFNDNQEISCHQFTGFNDNETNAWSHYRNIPQGEDCLYLNIYAPGNRIDVHKKKAVMVWIHGGAFLVSGTFTHRNMSFVAAHNNVIVVTIAYRLGLFGFLQLPGLVDGNLGLHDQVMALQWIQENIAFFGGDPNKITLFGESAGAISIGILMMYPKSQPLFRRVIMQSGAPTTMFSVGSKGGPIAGEYFLEAVGCPFTSRNVTGEKYGNFSQETLECLRKKNSFELLKASYDIAAKRRYVFIPVIDPVIVKKHPSDILDEAVWAAPSHKEVLMGINGNEGLQFVTVLYPKLLPKRGPLPKNLSFQMLEDSLIERFNLSRKRKQIHAAFGALFPSDNSSYTPLQVQRLYSNLLAEFAFYCPSISFVKSFLKQGNRTVYYYQFNPRAKADVNRTFNYETRALHGDELSFVYGNPVEDQVTFTPQEKEMSLKVMKDWATFAKTGKPRNMKWSPITNSDSEDMGVFFFDIPHSIFKPSELDPSSCETVESFYPQIIEKAAYYPLFVARNRTDDES